MRRLIFPLVFFLGLGLFSCSEKVYVLESTTDNLAKASTFTWVNSDAASFIPGVGTTSGEDELVRKTVNKYLFNNGWEEVNLDPDVLVVYDLMVPDRSNYKQVKKNYYNAFTRRYYPLNYPAGMRNITENDRNIKEAALFLSLVDANSDKVLWQGWTHQRMTEGRIDDSFINASVEALFKSFSEGK